MLQVSKELCFKFAPPAYEITTSCSHCFTLLDAVRHRQTPCGRFMPTDLLYCKFQDLINPCDLHIIAKCF